MAHALHDPVRHNAWATAQILEFCRGLDERPLPPDESDQPCWNRPL